MTRIECHERERPRAKLAFLALLVVTLAACSAPASLEVPRWDLCVDDECAPVTLPARPRPGGNGRRLRLATTVDLRDFGCEPVDLVLPSYLGTGDLETADGRSAVERDSIFSDDRQTTAAVWHVPVRECPRGLTTLTLHVRDDWAGSLWLDRTPRLVRARESSKWLRPTRVVNQTVSVLALAALLLSAAGWVFVYAMVRRRSTYVWYAMQALFASAYPAWVIGALPWSTSDATVLAIALLAAMACSVHFTAGVLANRSPATSVLLLLAACFLIVVTVGNPYVVGPPVDSVAFVVVATHEIVSCARACRGPIRVPGARLLLIGWISVVVTFLPDLAWWLGLGDATSGMRTGSVGLLVFGWIMSASMGKQFVVSLQEAERRAVEAEHLNAELRRLLKDRSRAVFSELARRVRRHEAAVMPIPGEIIANRYRVLQLLGAGGMGNVYEALRLSIGDRVAIKLAHTRDEAMLARLAREVELNASIVHPNVVRVLDFDCDEARRFFFVMELVPGRPLTACGAALRAAGRGAVLDILVQLANAVHALHGAGIIHRDLTPNNVLVVFGRHGHTVKVTDFGLSRRLAHPPLEADRTVTATDVGEALPSTEARTPAITRSGAVPGTPRYIAPEIWTGATATRASDVFAFGVIAFELLTGRRLITGPRSAVALSRSDEALLDAWGTSVADVVRACLSPRADDRPNIDVCSAALERGRN